MDLTHKNWNTRKAVRLGTILGLSLVTMTLSYEAMRNSLIDDNSLSPEGATASSYINGNDPTLLTLNARAGNSSMSPVLPLQQQMGALPFLNEAVRDPELLKQRPEDDGDATRLAHEIKDLRSNLATAKGERALEIHEQAYQGYATLGYYFEDVISGKIADAGRSQAMSNLTNVRTLMMQHAMKFNGMSKDKGAKARALYHINTTLVLMGQNKARAIGNLRDLQKQPLSTNLKRRAALLVAQDELNRGDNKRQATATLLANRNSLTVEGAIVSDLILAKTASGNSYRTYLSNAASRAGRLNQSQKDQLLAYEVAVWRRAEPKNWAQPPFNLKAFGDTLSVHAISERAALQAWNDGQTANGIRGYEALSRRLSGNPLKANIDNRLLDMQRIEYQRSKNPKPYEAALVSAYKVYLDPGVLGDNAETQMQQMTSNINSRHKALVHGEMARVANVQASNNERTSAIRLANNYLKNTENADEIEVVRAKIGNLYVLNKEHRQAVAIYRDLAENQDKGKARRYMTLAIASQSVLASWTTAVPWSSSIAKGYTQDREDLLSLYNKLGEQNPGQTDWFILGHTGLLEIQLGRSEVAFTAWQTGLKKNVSGSHAANATGYMLVSHQKASEWERLEALARLCEKSRIAALYRDKPVDVTAMFALALLEGGKQAIDGQKYAVAVKKLGEFVKRFPQAKNYDQGYFLLATAYRGNGQHKQSIITLAAFVDRFPSSIYYRQALLNGGDWSTQLAFEENTMFFYARFAKQFARDQEAIRVRDTLKDLYLGRGFYAEASELLSAQANAKGIDPTMRAAALATLMDVEERQGTVQRALIAADMIIKTSNMDPAVKADAYALKARVFAKNGQMNEVQRLEAQLSNLGDQSVASQDTLGEIRYLLARSMSASVIKNYFNLALQDPLSTINQRFAAYQKASTAFKSVCAAGQTSYCAPAMHQLARLSENFLKSLEDITVQDTLAKEVVSNFKNRKQGIMNEVTKTAQQSDDRSVAVLSEGYTVPDWTQAVLWHNSSDMDFDRVSGESGNGYVQWSE